MDICVYVHVNKIIRCEYNNRGGGGGVLGGGGGARVKLDKLGGGACPKSLKTPDLQYTYSINQSKIKVCFSIVFLVHFP